MELEEVDTGHKLWLQLSCSLLSDFLFHKTDLRTLHSTRRTHSPFTQSLLPRDPTFSTNWGLLISEVTLQVSSDCNRGWEKSVLGLVLGILFGYQDRCHAVQQCWAPPTTEPARLHIPPPTTAFLEKTPSIQRKKYQ